MGEPLPFELLSKLQRLLPSTKLLFAYGPTEASIYASGTIFDLSKPQAPPVLAGVPYPNTHLHILDKHLHVVPMGVPGQLYISGPCLARGYLKLPERTAEVFVHNSVTPDVGPGYERMYATGDLCRWSDSRQLQVLGRVDRQVGPLCLCHTCDVSALACADGYAICPSSAAVIDAHGPVCRQVRKYGMLQGSPGFISHTAKVHHFKESMIPD